MKVHLSNFLKHYGFTSSLLLLIVFSVLLIIYTQRVQSSNTTPSLDNVIKNSSPESIGSNRIVQSPLPMVSNDNNDEDTDDNNNNDSDDDNDNDNNDNDNDDNDNDDNDNDDNDNENTSNTFFILFLIGIVFSFSVLVIQSRRINMSNIIPILTFFSITIVYNIVCLIVYLFVKEKSDKKTHITFIIFIIFTIFHFCITYLLFHLYRKIKAGQEEGEPISDSYKILIDKLCSQENPNFPKDRKDLERLYERYNIQFNEKTDLDMTTFNVLKKGRIKELLESYYKNFVPIIDLNQININNTDLLQEYMKKFFTIPDYWVNYADINDYNRIKDEVHQQTSYFYDSSSE